MTMPKIVPCMVVVITKLEDGRKLEKLFNAMHIPIWNQCRGKGTAPSEVMDIFGLSGTTRLLTFTFLQKCNTKLLFEAMSRKLAFRQKGGGIAISIPVTGMQSHMLSIIKDEMWGDSEQRKEERLDRDMADTKEKPDYVVIWVSATSGYSDMVVDAARSAGARGGTVIKGRRRNSERVSQHLGVPTQEEQDFIMIVVPKAKKSEVMCAISDKCGLNTPARSVVVSLPVDDTLGLDA